MALEIKRAPEKLYTVEEFFLAVPDGQKADLLDGAIIMASPDSPDNNDLAGFLYTLLRLYARSRNLGRVFNLRVAFVLSPTRAPEPDIAFVSQRRLHIVQRGRCMGPPDLAVEVVSSDSVERDYDTKKRLYQEAGVPEYWIIDPLSRSCEFHTLREGRYAPVVLEGGSIFRSEVLPGFWLSMDWLFTQPLPDEYDCLQQILAESPS